MPNHNPVMIAHPTAQLDHMAQGQFYWGVGLSSTPGDYEMLGFDPDGSDRREYTRQSLNLILKIWEDPKPGLYESGHWRFTIPEPVDEIGPMFHLTPYSKGSPADCDSGGVPSLGDADHGRRARLDPRLSEAQ